MSISKNAEWQPTILVACDKNENLEPIETAVAGLGCLVTKVSTEQKIREALGLQIPIALLVFSHATGFECLTLIKKLKESGFPSPVLIFARHPKSEFTELAFSAGASDVLNVPFNARSLRSKIEMFRELASLRSRSVDLRNQEVRASGALPELHSFFLQAPIPMVVLTGPDHKFVVANEPYEKLVGRRVTGKTVREVFSNREIDSFITLIDQVYKTGIPFIGHSLPLNLLDEKGVTQEKYINVGYYPSRDSRGSIQGIMAIINDVTDEVRAKKIEERTTQAVENERANFRNLFKQTPEMVCILAGPEHRFEFVNEAHIKALGFDATGLSVREAQPESIEVHGILDEVYRTGITAQLHEIPVTLTDRLRYFNLTYAARRDINGKISGVMILGMEVSSEVEARKRTVESEEHFRNLVDNSPATMWVTDEEARCTYLSSKWYEITGGTPETDLGYGWVEKVHPDDRELASELFFNAVEAKGRLTIQYRLRQKDGSYRWAVDSGLPRFSKDGTFLGYIGTVVDVHDEITSQGELKDVQSRFAKSAEATDLGVWYCDLPFDVLSWNAQVKEHFFMAPDEHVTIQKFYEYMHPDDRAATEKAIADSIANEKPYDILYRTQNPKDPSQIKTIRAIGWTDYDGTGKPIRFDGITLDVTKDVRRENELKLAKEEAERANDLKSAFLANMSHEIRTPLGAMLGFAELLRDPALSPTKRANFIDIMTRNGKSLTVIIDDILDLSKVEAGHLAFEFTDVRAQDICENVVSFLRVKAKEKDLTLEYIYEESTPKSVVADPTRVRQILLNLVGNAIKFTQFGSVTLRSYGCETPTGRAAICFEVIDTGIGIPESQKENVFEMFVQADGSTTRRFGGTGLGLALSRRLARAMGGDIQITRTSNGQGTTFLVSIEDQPEKRTASNAPFEIKKRDNPLPERALEGLKILVVDDAPDNQQLIWSYLSRQGAIVESAENGLVGVRMALENDYDAVLMDIQMPEMDGYTATVKLRKTGYQKPIIALTAHAMNEVRDKILSLGATAHMAKPIHAAALISLIAKHTVPK